MRSGFLALSLIVVAGACRDDRPTAPVQVARAAAKSATNATDAWPSDSTLSSIGGANYLFTLVAPPSGLCYPNYKWEVMDVNRAGRAVLFCARLSRAGYWEEGMSQPMLLPLSRAWGVNDAGTIAGSSNYAFPAPSGLAVRSRGVLWSGGALAVVPEPPAGPQVVPSHCYSSELYDVNSAGHSVGEYHFVASTYAGCATSPGGSWLFLWRGQDILVLRTSPLNQKKPDYFKAGFVNDADNVVAYWENGWSSWRDGVSTTVARNSLDGTIRFNVWGDINTRGDVPLQRWEQDRNGHLGSFALLWSGGTIQMLPHAPYWGGQAFSVADDGLVAGTVFDSAFASPWIERGALWRNGILDQVVPCDPNGMCVQPYLFASRDLFGWVCSISVSFEGPRTCRYVYGKPVDGARALSLAVQHLRGLEGQRGQIERYTQLIENAIAAIERGNRTAARGMLSAVLNKLAASQHSGEDPLGSTLDAVSWLTAIVGNVLVTLGMP